MDLANDETSAFNISTAAAAASGERGVSLTVALGRRHQNTGHISAPAAPQL